MHSRDTHPRLETRSPPPPFSIVIPLSRLILSPDGLSCEGWACAKASLGCLGAGGVIWWEAGWAQASTDAAFSTSTSVAGPIS